MFDSIKVVQSLPDTLRLLNVSPNATLPDGYFVLIGVVLGAAISLFGNWLLARHQAHLQIVNSLFLRRLDVYLKLMELLEPGGIKQYTKFSTGDKTFPIPYTSYEDLSKWLNELTNFVAAQSLIIDDKSLQAFRELNKKVLEDLKSIANEPNPKNISEISQRIGIRSSDVVPELCTKVHNSAWDYFKEAYKVKL